MTITYEQIAERAFQIWEHRGAVEGKEKEYWTQAEMELRQEGLKRQKGKKLSSKDTAMFKTPEKSV